MFKSSLLQRDEPTKALFNHETIKKYEMKTFQNKLRIEIYFFGGKQIGNDLMLNSK